MPVNIPIAFLGGLVSFFAPCAVPLLPAYLSYITGVTSKSIKEKNTHFRRQILFSSLAYVLGFSIIFVLLGSAAAGFGVTLRRYSNEIRIIGGALMIVFGLEFAGTINLSFLARERKLPIPKWLENGSCLKAFLLGIIFAAAWTPCVGPVLGSILTLAAISSSAWDGAVLLFVYSLGITLPFLFLSLSLAQAPQYLSFIKTKVVLIARISGVILIAIGIALIFGLYAHINSAVLQLSR